MGDLIKKAAPRAKALQKAGDARHDPADLGSKAGAKLLDLPLSELCYNPKNERDEDLKNDPETIELAASMNLLGQVQAAVVVPRSVFVARFPEATASVTTPWVVMAGNRRRAAAEINEWPTLECIVRDRISDEMLRDIPIHENLHRKGLNPIKVAFYLNDKLRELGTQQAVADAVGKTQPWVNQMLKLLDLIPELQAAVKAEETTATTGRLLAKMSENAQKDAWTEAAKLPAEDRRAYWTALVRPDKSFIVPSAEGSVADGAREPATEGERSAARPAREKPAIVIRLAERSPSSLAQALRESLTDAELRELVQVLTQ